MVIASATAWLTWVGVTKLTFSQPVAINCCAVAAISRGEHGWPVSSWLMSWFWQKTQLRLQREKKMVPLPPAPTSTGSSPKCAMADDTRAVAPVWQAPNSPTVRSTPQARGHKRQLVSISCKRAMLLAIRLVFRVMRKPSVSTNELKEKRG